MRDINEEINKSSRLPDQYGQDPGSGSKQSHPEEDEQLPQEIQQKYTELKDAVAKLTKHLQTLKTILNNHDLSEPEFSTGFSLKLEGFEEALWNYEQKVLELFSQIQANYEAIPGDFRSASLCSMYENVLNEVKQAMLELYGERGMLMIFGRRLSEISLLIRNESIPDAVILTKVDDTVLEMQRILDILNAFAKGESQNEGLGKRYAKIVEHLQNVKRILGISDQASDNL